MRFSQECEFAKLDGDPRPLPAPVRGPRVGLRFPHEVLARGGRSGYSRMLKPLGFSGSRVFIHRDPEQPLFVGCFDEDGYTHDAECVTYTGPDAEFSGREICFLYNENTLTIADVTDKENIEQIARETYDNVYYTHQGW